jgi:hypothetical protein
VQQQAEPVVVEVAESVPDPLDFFDQEVDRFSGSVRDPVGVEVDVPRDQNPKGR